MTQSFAALRNGDERDFYARQAPKCPHCGSDFDVFDNDASFVYEEERVHEVECTTCEGIFEVVSTVTWKFSTVRQGAMSRKALDESIPSEEKSDDD